MNKTQFKKLLSESKGTKYKGIKYLAESLYEFIKSDGKYIINEQTGKRELLSETAYVRMYSKINNTKNYALLKEEYNKKFKTLIMESDKKMLSLLKEDDDVKVKNPGTGREISAHSAISAGPDHPAYKAAKQALAKAGGDKGHDKEDDHGGGHGDSHGDDHGGGHGHGDHGHHDHGPKNLSRGAQVAIAAAGVAAKALHLPGLDKVTNMFEKGADEIAGIAKEIKDVDGTLNKAKAFGKAAIGKIGAWGKEKAAEFTASMTDEATGARKSMGAILADKAGGVAKGVVKGLKEEVSHIGHQLGGGVDVAKKVLKGEKLTEEDKDKVVGAIKGVCTCAVIGMAVAAGPAGIAMKAAALALDPGEALKQLVTADIYSDLQRRGLITVIKEHKNKAELIRFLEGEGENYTEKFNEDKMTEILLDEGGRELQEVKSPMNDYEEKDMDSVVEYSEFAFQVKDENKNPSKGKESQKESLLRKVLKRDIVTEIFNTIKNKRRI